MHSKVCFGWIVYYCMYEVYVYVFVCAYMCVYYAAIGQDLWRSTTGNSMQFVDTSRSVIQINKQKQLISVLGGMKSPKWPDLRKCN